MLLFLWGLIVCVLYFTKPKDKTLGVFIKRKYGLNLVFMYINSDDYVLFKVTTVYVLGSKRKFIGAMGTWFKIPRNSIELY
jgi:hypothetical protein